MNGEIVPNAIQIALFMSDPPKADEIAKACFPKAEILSFGTQNDTSNADLAGDLERSITTSKGQSRIDFVWDQRSIPPDFNNEPIEIAAVEEDFQAIENFIDGLPVNRVACVFKVRELIADLASGLDKIDLQIPGLEIPEGATEITYRANIPGEVSGFQMNRIFLCQMGKVGFIKISNTGALEQVMQDVLERHFDVNTTHQTTLDCSKVSDAMKAVRSEATRFADLGLTGL